MKWHLVNNYMILPNIHNIINVNKQKKTASTIIAFYRPNKNIPGAKIVIHFIVSMYKLGYWIMLPEEM